MEHLGHASKSLGISRSAISHGIAALEEEIGRELFTRQGRNLFLNAHGKVFQDRVGKVITELRQIKEAVSSDQLDLQGHYRLAGTHLLCQRWLTPAWTRWQNQQLKMTAEISTLRSAQVVESVLSGELDFGVCVSPQGQPELERKVLFTSRLVPTVSRSHPVRKVAAAKRLAALSQYPAVLAQEYRGIEMCGQTHPIFKRYGISPRFDCLVDSYDTAVEKITGSQAWGLEPEFLVRLFPKLLASLPLPTDWDAQIEVCAVWRKSRPLTTALRGLMNELTAGVAAVGGDAKQLSDPLDPACEL